MVLIIDNFDSFTYNLYHYFLVLGESVSVKCRNEITIKDIYNLNPDYIVLSPGPGNPHEAELPLNVIDEFKDKKPIFGVCLGHQCIGSYFGGKIVKGIMPVHGKIHEVFHNNRGVFENIKNPLNVTRYHSLVISKEDFPSELEITAVTKDGEIMGIRHKKYNIEGVQFHPEAVLTENGFDILKNFLRSRKDV